MDAREAEQARPPAHACGPRERGVNLARTSSNAPMKFRVSHTEEVFA